MLHQHHLFDIVFSKTQQHLDHQSFLLVFHCLFAFYNSLGQKINISQAAIIIFFFNKRMSDSDKHSIKLEEDENPQIMDNEGDANNSYAMVNDNMQGNEDREMREDDNMLSGGLPGQPQMNKKRTHKKLEISNFIMKTYKILEDKRNSSIVEWTDQGNCFIVKDKQKFSKQILPKYFKHSKFSSFVRQLNMYDFHKIRKQKQIPIFKHKYFKMGCMDLLHKIKRKSGEDGKDEQMISKQLLNLSEPAISFLGSMSGIQNLTSKQSLYIKNNLSKQQSQMTIQGEIEMLKKENNQIKQNINQLTHDINFLQLSQQKRKEKLVKIITSLMFFQLNTSSFNLKPDSYSTLRKLQEHLISEEEPLSFSQYNNKLSQVYLSLKSRLI